MEYYTPWSLLQVKKKMGLNSYFLCDRLSVSERKGEIMTVLVPYKRMPIWNQDTVPQHFLTKHNTKVGTWAKIKVLKG